MENFANNPAIVTGLMYACAALTAAMLILAVVTFLIARTLTSLRERYASFMRAENSGGMTIEQLLDECLYEVKTLEKSVSSVRHRVSTVEERIPECFQKLGIVRYNPFDDTGGDLSYAIALLDEKNTGFILNGIYSRSGSYTYAKEVENGVSVKHKLSPEELEALQLAVRGEYDGRA